MQVVGGAAEQLKQVESQGVHSLLLTFSKNLLGQLTTHVVPDKYLGEGVLLH